MPKRIVVGITGASGVIYGIRLLEVLKEMNTLEVHLIISPSAERTIKIETDYDLNVLKQLSHTTYDYRDIGAGPASGSFLTQGMIILPCTIKTLSALANSYTDNLIVRAADVQLKEKRKLAVSLRESPFHVGHLKLMLNVAEMGAHIIPPIPAFYHQPKTIDDIIYQHIGKVLDYFQITHHLFKRWGD